MNDPRIADLLVREDYGAAVTVRGWLRTRRDSKGGFSFLELNDGSCLTNLQVVASETLANYHSEVLKLHPGSALQIAGTLRQSPGQGQAVEVDAVDVTILGGCDILSYPLQKRVSLERLREAAHLRVRTNTFGAVARVRNRLSFGTHRFFQERDFLYVNTPIITTSDCEGAGEMFTVTALPLAKLPLTDNGQVDFSSDFFGELAHLTVSGQLEAETFACGLSRVYTFGPTFRAENSNTSRHLAEFWMIEPEVAFADLDEDAQLAQEYLQYLFRDVLSACLPDLEFFDQRVDKGLIARLTALTEARFERLTYSDAIDRLQQAPVTFEFPVAWGIDLQSEHERYLTEQLCHGPVIITDFPRQIKPFYMRVNDDGKTVAAMDVLLPRIGEIIGGSQREERLEVIEQRLQETGMSADTYWWYLDLRRFGTVPHAGFGLGFERLVQTVTGLGNIRDVIPFPRTPHNAKF